MWQIMVLSVATTELWIQLAETFLGLLPGVRKSGKEEPQAVICTMEFKRIVWNTLALLKPQLKAEKDECPLT